MFHPGMCLKREWLFLCGRENFQNVSRKLVGPGLFEVASTPDWRHMTFLTCAFGAKLFAEGVPLDEAVPDRLGKSPQ